jgi:hypothetical protein
LSRGSIASSGSTVGISSPITADGTPSATSMA